MRRSVVVALIMVAAMFCGCSSSTTGSSTAGSQATDQTTLDVSPCNYARVWRDDPSQFVEFATEAHFARTASSSQLRSEGHRLALAVLANDPTTITGVMETVVATCEHLGLIRATPATSTTSG